MLRECLYLLLQCYTWMKWPGQAGALLHPTIVSWPRCLCACPEQLHVHVRTSVSPSLRPSLSYPVTYWTPVYWWYTHTIWENVGADIVLRRHWLVTNQCKLIYVATRANMSEMAYQNVTTWFDAVFALEPWETSEYCYFGPGMQVQTLRIYGMGCSWIRCSSIKYEFNSQWN